MHWKVHVRFGGGLLWRIPTLPNGGFYLPYAKNIVFWRCATWARDLALAAIWYAFLGIYGRISICLVLFPFYCWLRSGLDKAHNFTKAIAEKTSFPSGHKPLGAWALASPGNKKRPDRKTWNPTGSTSNRFGPHRVWLTLYTIIFWVGYIAHVIVKWIDFYFFTKLGINIMPRLGYTLQFPLNTKNT